MRYVVFLLLILGISGCTDRGIPFTRQEQAYINTHIVDWSVEEGYYPFIFVKNGEPTGLSRDFLELISAKSGLRFRSKSQCQLIQCFSLLEHGHTELITSVRTTPTRSRVARFSRPYIHIDSVMIYGVGRPKTVGIGRGYAIFSYLSINRKDLTIIEFDNDDLAAAALKNGEVDAVALDEISAIHLQKKYHLELPKVYISHEYPLAFAAQKENHVLISILDKTLNSLSKSETEKIIRKWK